VKKLQKLHNLSCWLESNSLNKEALEIYSLIKLAGYGTLGGDIEIPNGYRWTIVGELEGNPYSGHWVLAPAGGHENHHEWDFSAGDVQVRIKKLPTDVYKNNFPWGNVAPSMGTAANYEEMGRTPITDMWNADRLYYTKKLRNLASMNVNAPAGTQTVVEQGYAQPTDVLGMTFGGGELRSDSLISQYGEEFVHETLNVLALTVGLIPVVGAPLSLAEATWHFTRNPPNYGYGILALIFAIPFIGATFRAAWTAAKGGKTVTRETLEAVLRNMPEGAADELYRGGRAILDELPEGCMRAAGRLSKRDMLIKSAAGCIPYNKSAAEAEFERMFANNPLMTRSRTPQQRAAERASMEARNVEHAAGAATREAEEAAARQAAARFAFNLSDDTSPLIYQYEDAWYIIANVDGIPRVFGSPAAWKSVTEQPVLSGWRLIGKAGERIVETAKDTVVKNVLNSTPAS
jgi:hypothetical protein